MVLIESPVKFKVVNEVWEEFTQRLCRVKGVAPQYSILLISDTIIALDHLCLVMSLIFSIHLI